MGSERKRRARAERRLEQDRSAVGLKERDEANKESMQTLLEEQRAVLDHAAAIVRDAGLQLGAFTREEVTPKVRDTMTHKVKPLLAGGAAATALAGKTAKQKITDDVLPAVSGAVEKAKRAGKKFSSEAPLKVDRVGKKAVVVEAKPAPGPGRYILLGLGVVALAGLAYAVWQTLRADDDLWIEDEPEALEEEVVVESVSTAPPASIAPSDAPASNI